MMRVETYAPSCPRSTYEQIRCRTEQGIAEFQAEVARIQKIRADFGEEWEPVVVNLLYGDTVLERREVT